MRIVLTSSEAVPFSKTGGLADVASALPKALAQQGHDVWLITPHYPQQLAKLKTPIPEPVRLDEKVQVRIRDRVVEGGLLQTSIPGTTVRVLLLDQPGYFDRPSLYNDASGDYGDNCERFTFLSRAVFEACRVLNIHPDVIHANDWQTALVPALLRIEWQYQPGFERTASVFTIHNMAFQGQFWHWDMEITGLDWSHFNWREAEFHGQLNLLKLGIVHTDMVTTVSPSYAAEIQTGEFGCGLNSVLTSRREDLVGILNGIDPEVWNPSHDPSLPSTYTSQTIAQGKPVCKAYLQKHVGLPVRFDVPLFGMVSRMTSQKGFDLIRDCAQDLMNLDIQMVFLGTGDPAYEGMLRKLAAENPEKVATTIGYNEDLSHLIEAGSDLFLMPSQFEPCGLNQMYSLAYGTVPIVRAVGGLADSVVDATEANIASGRANGFTFYEYNSATFFRQICRALGLFLDKKTWLQLTKTGMERDWSWNRSANEYLNVYQRALIKRAHGE